MPNESQERQIQLTLNALRTNPNLKLHRVATQFEVPDNTLRRRMNGIPSKRGTRSVQAKLTLAEEEAIVQYILDLDSRGFSPTKCEVEDMANLLLSQRDATPVGKCWADRLITRREELKTRLNRPYDYQRAKQEDPAVVEPWFRLVANMRAKYGVADSDFYNFDETGFMMGQIQPFMVVTRSDRRGKPKRVQAGNREWVTAICAVAADGFVVPPFLCVKGRYHLSTWFIELVKRDDTGKWSFTTTSNGWTDNATGLKWLRHFDRSTQERRKGAFRMLVLDGHESHVNAEFDAYCKEAKIIPLCLPAHSSHLTQPLDVGVFSPLKTAYGAEISALTRNGFTHVTKDDFAPAFCTAFKKAFTPENILGGFRGAGLVPFDPQAVLSKCDVRIISETPLGSPQGLPDTWASQTPQNVNEALSQATLIKSAVDKHQGSSPTPIFKAVDQLTKATVANTHRFTLLENEVKALREANATLSKRRRAKKVRLQDSGVLTVDEAGVLMAQKGVVAEGEEENPSEGRCTKRRKTGSKACGICRKSGHNARTCPEGVDISSLSDSKS